MTSNQPPQKKVWLLPPEMKPADYDSQGKSDVESYLEKMKAYWILHPHIGKRARKRIRAQKRARYLEKHRDELSSDDEAYYNELYLPVMNTFKIKNEFFKIIFF